MKSRIIIIVLLLALLIAGGQLYIKASGQQSAATTADNDTVLNAIKNRTSGRAYKNQPVEKEKVEKLLRAGMAAPSAMDRRPWHFVVVTDKQLLGEIGQAMPNASYAAKAPLAIVVCGDMNKAIEGKGRDFWVQDCSAATENILLAAQALGLGAVWTGAYPGEDRCATLTKLLNLPENFIPLNTIVIGYPAAPTTPKDKWDEDNITYNKFE